MREIFELMSALGYRIVQDTDQMDVYGSASEAYKDVFIRMIYKDEAFCFYMVNQGKMYPKGFETDFTKAMMDLYILCRSIYDPSPDQEICIRLRALVKKQDYEAADELVSSLVPDKYYSMNDVDPDKISLVVEREKCSAFYQGRTIDKSMTLGRGYVVLLNCSRWLARFDDIYRELAEKTSAEADFKDLAYIYIFEEIRG